MAKHADSPAAIVESSIARDTVMRRLRPLIYEESVSTGLPVGPVNVASTRTNAIGRAPQTPRSSPVTYSLPRVSRRGVTDGTTTRAAGRPGVTLPLTTTLTSGDGSLRPQSLLARTRTKYVPFAAYWRYEAAGIPMSNVAMFVAPGRAPTSTTYDVAPAGPVVSTGIQVRFTAAGVAELAAGVTDAAAFGGAGGGATQISCASARPVLPAVAHAKTTQNRTLSERVGFMGKRRSWPRRYAKVVPTGRQKAPSARQVCDRSSVSRPLVAI